MQPAAEEILNFWFMEVGPDLWFVPDPVVDELVRVKYGEACAMAAHGDLKAWENTPEGMLALMLLLDQFPRRMFRGTARAYETDDLARELAREAIIKHFDDRIDRLFKLFFYLPFAHSESAGDQRLSIFYIRERTKDDRWLDSAEWRCNTVLRFGRFPHRNAALGRESTPDELAFLEAEAAVSPPRNRRM